MTFFMRKQDNILVWVAEFSFAGKHRIVSGAIYGAHDREGLLAALLRSIGELNQPVKITVASDPPIPDVIWSDIEINFPVHAFVKSEEQAGEPSEEMITTVDRELSHARTVLGDPVGLQFVLRGADQLQVTDRFLVFTGVSGELLLISR